MCREVYTHQGEEATYPPGRGGYLPTRVYYPPTHHGVYTHHPGYTVYTAGMTVTAVHGPSMHTVSGERTLGSNPGIIKKIERTLRLRLSFL